MNGTQMTMQAIRKLDATEQEREALCEILDIEGFAGEEDDVETPEQADALAAKKLVWARFARFPGNPLDEAMSIHHA